jgi:hypothetical protein
MSAGRFARLLFASALGLLLLTSVVGAPSTAAEGQPIGGCPAGFDFPYPVSKLPPDTAGLASLDGNGDGWTCVNLIAFNNPHGTRFAAVDNVVPLP